MNFPNRLSTLIEAEVGKRTFLVFAILLTSLGVISAIAPFYTLITLGGIILLLLLTLNPKEAFFVAGIFLILQAAIVRNLYLLGSPERVTNTINRVDEFIWLLFIIYILIRNYKGDTWQFKKTNLDSIVVFFAFIGFISAILNHNSLEYRSRPFSAPDVKPPTHALTIDNTGVGNSTLGANCYFFME